MTGKELVGKLIFRAPPDLLADIYERIRRGNEFDDHGAGSKRIVGRAQTLEIFTTEEVHTFLHFVSDRFPEAA